MKKISYFFLIVISSLIGCSSQYSLKDLNDYSKLDSILKKQQYNYSDELSTKNFSLIKYDNKNFSIEEYNACNNSSTNLEINSNDYFILSFPTNAIITYSWDANNINSFNIANLNHKSTIHLDRDTSKTVGLSYDRENFYFSPVNTGTQTLTFEYKSTQHASTDNFKITLNIKINK